MKNVCTTEFIKALRNKLQTILPTFYEEAPTQGGIEMPYAVIRDYQVAGIDACDLVLFDVEIWSDERKEGAAVATENLCDTIRNELTGTVLAKNDVFFSHIGFEGMHTITENEFDLAHKRIGFSARIFYNDESGG